MARRYRLTLCAGEPEEQVVYAHLTDNDLEMIMADMSGELNCEYLIILDNGETIDTGIIDDIDRVKCDGCNECPLGGDIEDDCADCIYSCDYHFVDGECVKREESAK